MKTKIQTKKFGALFLGLMFLVSTLGVAFAGTANEIPSVPVWHSLDVGPDGTQPVPDTIKLVDANGNVFKSNIVHNTASTTFWIERESGTTLTLSLVAEKATYQTQTQAFTVDGNSPGQLPAMTYKLVTGGAQQWTLTVNVATGSATADLIEVFEAGTSTLVASSTTGTLSQKLDQKSYDVKATKAGYTAFTSTVLLDADKTVPYNLVQGAQTGDIIVKDFDFSEKTGPGQTVEFDIELDSNASYDAENVEATVVVKKLADGDDVESAVVDFGNIDKGDDATETASIKVPVDANDQKYSVEVELEWVEVDANGNDVKTHKAIYTAADKLEVVKAKHQVQITSVQMDKQSYESGDTVQLAVSVLNTGANDETVQVKVAADVNAQAQSATITLKEGDSSTQYLTFVIPEATKDGNYFAVVSATYSGTSAIQKLVLAVKSASAVDEDSVVIIEDAETQKGTELPAAGVALGIVALILAALLLYFGKDLIGSGEAAAKPAASRSK